MLRCSHATALRTRLSSGAALRAPLSSPWAKAPRSCSLLAPALRTAQTPTSLTAQSQIRLLNSWSDLERGVRVQEEDKLGEEDGTRDEDAVAERTHRGHAKRGKAKWTPGSKPSIRKRQVGKEDAKFFGPWTIRTIKENDLLFQIASNKIQKIPSKAAEMELRWIKDRTMLAERVRRLLSQGDVLLAATLARMARREKFDCVVAWNHILAHCMKAGSPLAAWKFWNDMKKRGVPPNEFSYTIMLDGLKNSDPQPGFSPMSQALKLYGQLKLPSSQVKPNVIITNAMLSVFARYNEMDSIWEIAGELPEEGPGSPDDITYTIILNAIRGSLHKDLAQLRVDEELKVYRRRLLALTEGKRVWTDVVYRWKQGQIEMKNKLVSAMASLLLEGPMDRHMHEVFYLYHQTTGIPILSGTPSDVPSQRSKAFRSKALQSLEDVPFVNESGDYISLGKDIEPEEIAEVEAEEQNGFKDIFNPVVSPDVQPYSLERGIPPDAPSTGPNYMPLTPADLSLIMRAALLTQEWGTTGKGYWDHLTLGDVPYRITPDEECYKAYLRILRISRSSRMALEVLRSQILPSGGADGVYFHIAMGVCRRDRNNYMIFRHASEILSMMDKHLILPDTRVVNGYFDLVQYIEATPAALLDLEDLDQYKRGRSKKLLSIDVSNFHSKQVRELQVSLELLAIENLQPIIATLKAALDEVIDGPPELFRRPGADQGRPVGDGQMGHDVITILTRMRQLIDNVLKYRAPRQISEEACHELKKQSLALRKYSKMEIYERYRDRTIYPTKEQRHEFAQHEAEAEARKRRDAGMETAELSSEVSPSELPPFKLPESQLPTSPSEDPSLQESSLEAPQLQVSQSQETQPQETQADEPQLEKSQSEEAKVDDLQEIPWEQILSRQPRTEDTAQSEMPQPQEVQSQDPLPQEDQIEESESQEEPRDSLSETSALQEDPIQDPLPQEVQTKEAESREQPRDSLSETAPPQEAPIEESLSQEPHSQEPQSDETQAKESRSDNHDH